MKIVFTGGATGGHFYPLIAVAEQINDLAREKKLISPELYFVGPDPYDERALFENNIVYKHCPAGKLRRYFSVVSAFDFFKTGWGIATAIRILFFVYPDVIFSKGGYGSFPTVVAARLLRIPLVIHDSDSKPGRVNLWAGKFARRIAISYPDSASFFDKKRVALTGNPIRKALYKVAPEGGREYLKLAKDKPTILILGGSQGAERINDTILDTLPKLLAHYQVIHQTGTIHESVVSRTATIVLQDHETLKAFYHVFGFLNVLGLRMAAGASDLIVSRAGSQIFEIALWEKPSILIPIPEDISHDQRSNAYSYARSGGAVVIEERNLTPNVLLSEIKRLIDNPAFRNEMAERAKTFARPDAARVIAKEIVDIALSHEPVEE